MDFVIKMPTQDCRERDSTETETVMKTKQQQAKRSLPGRGEDKSGLSFQVYLKRGVIRLNFRGLYGKHPLRSFFLFIIIIFNFFMFKQRISGTRLEQRARTSTMIQEGINPRWSQRCIVIGAWIGLEGNKGPCFPVQRHCFFVQEPASLWL